MASIQDLGDGKYRVHVTDGFLPNGKVNRTNRVIKAKSSKDAERQAQAIEVDFKRGTIESKNNKGFTFADVVAEWRMTEINPCEKADKPKMMKRKPRAFDEQGIINIFDSLDFDVEQDETPLYYDSINKNWDTKLNEDEAQALRKTIRMMHKVYVHLAIITTCRRSELLGLEWGDINYNKNLIYIRRTSHYTREKGIYNQYKMKNGKESKEITMLPELMVMLKEYENIMKETRKIMGDKWYSSERVFVAVYGGPITKAGTAVMPNNISQWFGRFIKRNNLEKLSLHKLRASGISYLLNKGMDIVSLYLKGQIIA